MTDTSGSALSRVANQLLEFWRDVTANKKPVALFASGARLYFYAENHTAKRAPELRASAKISV